MNDRFPNVLVRNAKLLIENEHSIDPVSACDNSDYPACDRYLLLPKKTSMVSTE
jgi:hypothetical protein